jgi:predicted aldo/keto reductase-like oxidoreductase
MMAAHNPQYLDTAWALGIRYFDTAMVYIRGKSEQHVAQWLTQHPERRKELFLVNKSMPHNGPQDLLGDIDARLKSCATDYIDLLFIHGMGPGYGGEDSVNWLKSKELKDAVEQLKKSGKIRLFGFSCHDKQKARYLQAAAEGGFIDAIMVAHCPALPISDEFNRALDACQKAGVGLISMKQMKPLKNLPKRLPEFDKLGLTAHQALLHACWSDERFASVCSQMENLEEMNENAAAARAFKKPLTPDQIKLLGQTAVASLPTMCPNCDGRCIEACGRQLALNDIARFVTYYERDGNLEAREYYQALAAELRNPKGADLAAARHACLAGLDFAAILEKAQRYFA